MKKIILIQFIGWHFFEMPVHILKVWKNFLKFNLNYFSIPLLIQTFFSPWRRHSESYGKGFDFQKWFEAFGFNLVARGVGMIMRTILIIVGLVVQIFIFVAGLSVLLIWIILPALFLFGLWAGLKIIF